MTPAEADHALAQAILDLRRQAGECLLPWVQPELVERREGHGFLMFGVKPWTPRSTSLALDVPPDSPVVVAFVCPGSSPSYPSREPSLFLAYRAFLASNGMLQRRVVN